MRERLKIPYPVIVEGKYDRLRLDSVIEARIITTDGFGVFRNAEKSALLRALARSSPLIVLTDPDGAGGVIRSYLTGILPPDRVIRLYVPRVCGTEARKAEPSAEGILGVEGIDAELLRELFAPYADPDAAARAAENRLCMADFYRDGLTGARESAARRDLLGEKFGLPPHMSAKALLSALKFIITYEEYLSAVQPPEPDFSPENSVKDEK